MCDALAREALVDFQLGLLGVVRRDYKSPEYLFFFPDGFDAAKKRSAGHMRAVLLAIVAHIAMLEKGSPLQAHAKPLNACAVAYVPALAADEKAAAAMAQAETQLSVARAQWLLVYDGLYGDVRSMFPGRKALVESFFPDWTKKKVEKVELPN